MLLVFGMIGILLILFTPISPAVLDFLLILNFSAALMILLVTFYTEKPLEFSTFPSLLLMTTLFRLALNISATRLILDGADAGKVIDAVGEHVVGGNYIIGLVVFLILIIVQYVVVTNGAQRVAEVAARFILDSLPGKQMSIDADLNMGIIDQEEAKKRRSLLEKESNFYGAMDGASKFVKGDAIAGIIIILIDIIGGLTIGIVQLGMSWGDALHKYTLLTVGDGIVTQIPSLVIAVATGIIITRAATDARLASEITRQFSAHPKTLLIVIVALASLMFLPGIPSVPVIFVIAFLAVLCWFAYRKKSLEPNDDEVSPNEGNKNNELPEDDLAGAMKLNAFELRVGLELADAYFNEQSELENRVALLRKQLANKLGLLLPPLVTVKDSDLRAQQYSICAQGIKLGGGFIKPNHLLAINASNSSVKIEGEPTREPTYGLPAQWIENNARAQAHAAGYTLVDPETVLLTHIQETSRQNASIFLTRAETERLVEQRREELGSLIDELVPTILSYSDVQGVLQSLLEEQVSIKNLPAILEVLVDAGRQIKDKDQLTECVREKIGPSICTNLSDADGKLNIITLAPELEQKFIRPGDSQKSINNTLMPDELELFLSRVAGECEKMLGKNLQPILLCAAPIRRMLRKLLIRAVPQINVLSINEISGHAEIVSSSVIDIGSQQGDKQ